MILPFRWVLCFTNVTHWLPSMLGGEIKSSSSSFKYCKINKTRNNRPSMLWNEEKNSLLVLEHVKRSLPVRHAQRWNTSLSDQTAPRSEMGNRKWDGLSPNVCLVFKLCFSFTHSTKMLGQEVSHKSQILLSHLKQTIIFTFTTADIFKNWFKKLYILYFWGILLTAFYRLRHTVSCPVSSYIYIYFFFYVLIL